MAKLMVRAIWDPRESSEGEGVVRLVTILAAAATEHAAFSRWFLKGKSRTRALREPVPIDEGSIRSSLQRNHTDLDRAVIEDLGWSWSVWNGGTGGADVSCSCNFGLTSPRLKNRFLLGLPPDLDDATDVQTRLLAVAQSVWQPDDLSIWASGDGAVHRLDEPTSD